MTEKEIAEIIQKTWLKEYPNLLDTGFKKLCITTVSRTFAKEIAKRMK